MNNLSRLLLYILTIAAVVVVSAFGPTIAYAEDGQPPDPAPQDPLPESSTSPPAEASSPEAPAPPAEVQSETDPPPPLPDVQTEQAEPPENTEAPADTPSEDSVTSPVEGTLSETTEPLSVPEVLEQIPGETALVVLNEEGTAEPLASQEAAEILVEGDPVWCPVGQAPGSPGCSNPHTTFTGVGGLIDDLTNNNYSGDGVIWVEANYDRSLDSGLIEFDHTSGDLTQLGNLTIIGGWNGSSPSVLDDPMSFVNWTGNIEIKNLEFENALSTVASLQVETDGDITLNNVSVTGNTSGGAGAILDNCQEAGAGCTTSGNVSVRNSDFSSNVDTNSGSEDGLLVTTSGSVTILDTTAKDNGDAGIVIGDWAGDGFVGTNLYMKNVAVTGNYWEGIDIDDFTGDATLKYITVNDNGADGLEIDDVQGSVYVYSITANGNGYNASADGIDIDDTGEKVSVYNATANNNDGAGIEIDRATGTIKVKDSTANYNGEDGINIDSNGTVIVKCSKAKENTGDGFDISGSPDVRLLSANAVDNGADDYNLSGSVVTVKKKIDCSAKKGCQTCKTCEPYESPYTKLVCGPSDTTASLTDPLGNEVSFENLCGYDAGVFDKTSKDTPKYIPGAGEYVSDLYARLLEYLTSLGTDGVDLTSGMYAMILYDLAYVIPPGYDYESALLVVVLENGSYLDPLTEGSEVTVKFQMPDSLDDDEELTITWWNGMDWDDLGGAVSEDGLFFQVTTDKIGVFVLAIQ